MPNRARKLDEITENHLAHMSTRELKELSARVLSIQQQDRKENQLFYYEPWPQNRKVHESTARVLGVGGGNGSAKTETMLVEMVMCATGIVPQCFRDENGVIYPWVLEKFRGPISMRLVVESLTTTLETVILPKLQYFTWTGVDAPGGAKGHWGWIPHSALLGGSWEKSWSSKLRVLKMHYRNPITGNIEGTSTLQCMSKDQDPTDFASGDFHIVGLDEPPSAPIFTENQARTMRVAGRIILAMTWPDDPSIPVDWIHDEIYEPAQPGLGHKEGYEWINLYTTDNPNLDQDAIAKQMEAWDETTKAVRIYGQPIRFSNRIHPLFTDQDTWWCFHCGQTTLAADGKCGHCQSTMLSVFNHVGDYPPERWPAVFLLDPHPRKPHMYCWVQVDAQDDYTVVAEGQCDGDPVDLRDAVLDLEAQRGIRVGMRLMDPNMGRSPSGAQREMTWQDEFDAVGLVCDLADDSSVGRQRLNAFLKPDPRTRRPRIHFDRSCVQTVYQLKRYVWDDWKKGIEKDQKQKPRMKYDDYPTLLKYLMNAEPTFDYLFQGPQIINRRTGKPRDAMRRAG